MITRIRYTTSGVASGWVSKQKIMLGNGELISVQLLPQEDGTFVYWFVNSTGSIISKASTNSLPALKKLVKESLVVAGVQFEKEVRNRTDAAPYKIDPLVTYDENLEVISAKDSEDA